MEAPTDLRRSSQGPILPGRRPLIGHLHRMRRDPLGTLLEASKLGDVARLDFGPRGEVYLISHPDGVKRVLLDNYTNHPIYIFGDGFGIIIDKTTLRYAATSATTTEA